MPPKAQHVVGYRKLPVFLRKMRENAGLTQRQIGAKLGKPQSWVFNCEVANRRVDLSEFCTQRRAAADAPGRYEKRLINCQPGLRQIGDGIAQVRLEFVQILWAKGGGRIEAFTPLLNCLGQVKRGCGGCHNFARVS